EKKPTWADARRHSPTSAYSSTGPPAVPGYPSPSHPTTSIKLFVKLSEITLKLHSMNCRDVRVKNKGGAGGPSSRDPLSRPRLFSGGTRNALRSHPSIGGHKRARPGHGIIRARRHPDTDGR